MTTIERIYDLPKRIADRIAESESECWQWLGAKSANGYGVASIHGKSMCAHRAVYILAKGPIPKGLELDHLCRNQSCVRPSHLDAVTHRENMFRSPAFQVRVQSGKCIHGHDLDGVRSRFDGGRYCKTCVNLNKRRYRAKA